MKATAQVVAFLGKARCMMDNNVTSLAIHFIETTGHQDWSEVCAEANALAPLFKERYESLIPDSFPFTVKPTPEEGVLDIDGKEFKTLSIGVGILLNDAAILGRCLFALLKSFPKCSTPQSIEEDLCRQDWSNEFCRQYGCFIDFHGLMWTSQLQCKSMRLIRCPDGSIWFDGKPEDERRPFFDIAKEKLYMLKLNQDLQSTGPK